MEYTVAKIWSSIILLAFITALINLVLLGCEVDDMGISC
jgi:hypothetical protein